MKFNIAMTLTTDVTLTKDVEFQVEAESKGQAKRMVDAMLEDFQTFSEDPEGDKLFETLKAQGFDFRDLASYDGEEITAIGAEDNEYEVCKAGD